MSAPIPPPLDVFSEIAHLVFQQVQCCKLAPSRHFEQVWYLLWVFRGWTWVLGRGSASFSSISVSFVVTITKSWLLLIYVPRNVLISALVDSGLESSWSNDVVDLIMCDVILFFFRACVGKDSLCRCANSRRFSVFSLVSATPKRSTVRDNRTKPIIRRYQVWP